jgi:hypothetical protein
MRTWQVSWWATWLLVFLVDRSSAQDFAVGLVGSPNPARVGAPTAFQLAVTNLANLNVTNFAATVVFQGPVEFVSATNRFGVVTNFTDTVIFFMGVLTNNTAVTFGYTLRPTSFGTINHAVLIEASNVNAMETNFVTRIISGEANLGVKFGSIPSGTLAGDLLAYQLLSSNSGPDAALAVELTHTLAPGLRLLGIDPPEQTFVQVSNRVVVLLGAMTNGASSVLQFRVQPTASGALPLEAAIAAPGLGNPGTNAQANATLTIATPGPGQLAASIAGPQVFNPQTGLVEQRVNVANVGTTSIQATRVMVSGLTNWLYNAAGTNGTTPFVVVRQTLAPGASTELLLQYFNRTRQPGANPMLSGLDVPMPGPTRPTGNPIPSSPPQPLPDGSVVVEFPTIPGRRYAVLYGSDPSLANGAALPVLVAPSSRLPWFDYGLPLTAPAQAPIKFYQVIEVTGP